MTRQEPFIWPAGLMTALVTPMKDDRVDDATLGSLLEHQIRAGAKGVVVGGGTGEFGALSTDERKQLGRKVIDQVAGRIAVVVQPGALATRDAIELGQDAQAAGVDALMVASPFGEPINWRERVTFYQHFTTAVSVPVMVYNTPAAGGLSLPQLQELANLPHVNAIKDSSGDPELMGDVLTWAADRDFAVYAGKDSLLYDSVLAGARGAVMGAASFIPDLFVEVIGELQRHGSTPRGHERWRQLRTFLRFVEQSSNYVAMCKAGCRLEGLDVGDVRLPFLMPTPGDTDELADKLRTVREAFGDIGTQPVARAADQLGV